MPRDFRTISLRILNDVLKTGKWATDSIEANVKSIDEEHRDIKKVYELVYGILRNKNFIDYHLSTFLNRPTNDETLQNILRIGYYQLRYMRSIPSYAAINTCVNLAKTHVHPKTGGFVNAVLRKVMKDKLKVKIGAKSKEEYLSVKYSYQVWFIRLLMKAYPKKSESIMKAGNIKPPVFLKVNSLRTQDSRLKSILKKQGVEAEPARLLKGAYLVKQGDASKTPAFEQGFYYIQDLSSQLLCGFVSPRQKDAVIDIGSAPGGKAAGFAESMRNKGQIIAVEPVKSRVVMMQRNFVRLGITNVEIMEHDAANDIEALHDKGDRVIVDAPCSGLGVIRRHPEKKWGLSEEETKDFPKLQLAILNTAAKWVKKKGELYYSTCTINPEENEKVIEKFLKKNTGFKAVDIAGKLKKLEEFKSGKYFLSLPGNKHNMDGFFIAKLVKR